MKRIVCIVVMACVILGAAFAQAKPATPAPAPAPAPAKTPQGVKSSFGVDLFQLVKGFIASDSDSKFSVFIISAGYERLVAPHFSFGVDGDLYILDFDGTKGNYFSVTAAGRYYPQADFEKFFLGTTLGFNSLTIDGSTKPENGGFSGLTISLKMGYKVLMKGFYLEPSLAYVLSKTSIASLFGFGIPTPLGWNGGLRLGFMF